MKPTILATIVCLFGVIPACEQPDDDPDDPGQPDPPTVPQTDTYALEGATLIDGTGDDPVDDAVIIIDDGQFTAAGPGDDIDAPDDIETVDLTGFTVIPGLIDSHAHLGPLVVGHDEDRGGEDDVPPNTPTEDLVDIVPQFVDHGVTTVKSVGDVFPWIVEARDAVDAEGVDTPQILTSGPLFTAPGGHPAATIYAHNPWLAEGANAEVGSADEARDAVEEVADGGVDFIKIVYDDGDGRFERLDDEVMETIIDEASDHDLKVTAHVGDDDETRRVIKAGVDGIEHARPLSDETIERMVDEEVFFVPTLAVYDSLQGGVAPAISDSVDRAADAGVNIVAGSDVGNPSLVPGASLHRELRLLVDAGLTPHDALVAATSTAARFLGKPGEVGEITAGARATLLVVEDDPLHDIDAAAEPVWVIHHGDVVQH